MTAAGERCTSALAASASWGAPGRSRWPRSKRCSRPWTTRNGRRCASCSRRSPASRLGPRLRASIAGVERTLFGKPARFEGGLHEVAPGVFAWLQPNGEWGESNAGLVVGADEALLVDTLWDTRLTRRMLDAVDARVGVRIGVVVNTHSDGDHVWGNQLLDGAPIVSTDTAIEIIREEPPSTLQRFKSVARPLRLFGTLPLPVVGTLPLPVLPRLHLRELGGYIENMLGPYDFADVRLTPPTQGFSGGLVGEAGGREVLL